MSSYYHQKVIQAQRQLRKSEVWTGIAKRYGYGTAASMLRERGESLQVTVRLLGLTPRGSR